MKRNCSGALYFQLFVFVKRNVTHTRPQTQNIATHLTLSAPNLPVWRKTS